MRLQNVDRIFGTTKNKGIPNQKERKRIEKKRNDTHETIDGF